MSRARPIVLTVVAASFVAALLAFRESGGPVATVPSARRVASRTSPAARRGARPAMPDAAAALAPRPGRQICFFRARSRGADVGKIARDLIDEHRRELGLDAMPGELRVTREFDSLSGRHLRMEQTLGGVPVFGSEVSAHVAKDGRPLLVQADVFPIEGARSVPDVSAETAVAAAVEWTADDEDAAPAETKPPRLVILPEGRRGRLAWRVDVRTGTESSRVFVDAADGEVVRTDSLRIGADGTAAVFDPNPIYTLRDGSLRDHADADSARLTSALVVIELRRLDGTGYLRGQWADVTATRNPTQNLAFDWSAATRGDLEFEQVMAYYHVDRAQQRLQDLGVTNANATSQRVDAHALAEDQSYFDAFNDVIRLGDGGVDDAEDADIIRHEYGHALQYAQVPDWGVTDEGAAMGEGFGDFHAASFHSGDPAFDPLIGSWDASAYSTKSPPYLRRVDGTKRYPQDVKSEPHADGEIWSRFLWDLRALVGTDAAVRVVVESHFLLTANAGFVQGANAVLLANVSLRAGADDVAIRDLLDARGLLYTVPLADPPADDAMEENDDIDHPATIAAGLYTGLEFADEDWYRLDVPPERRLRVQMNYATGRADLQLALALKLGAGSSQNELVRTTDAIDGHPAVDAAAGPDGATYYLRVFDAAPGTHAAPYDLVVTDAELLELSPGRATAVSLTRQAPSVFRVYVPSSKVGRHLRIVSQRRRKGGTAPEVRLVSPSGQVVVDFGAGKDRGSRAAATLTEAGSWIVEIRSRTGTAGGVKLRADYR